MKRYYKFAGVELEISVPDQYQYREDSNLEAFRTEQVTDPHRFSFELVDELDPPRGELLVKMPGFLVFEEGESVSRYIGSVEGGWEYAYIRAWHCGKEHKVQVKTAESRDAIFGKTVLTTIAAEHLIAQSDGFVFHCSYINHNGKAILFTAPSETGKSTQADLWHNLRDSVIINGDRAAVRLVDGELRAEGIPFSGSSKFCVDSSLPIEAIVYLAQAPSTTIRRLRGYQAFVRIWEGIFVNTWDRGDLDRVSALAEKVAGAVPIYYLACTQDESAVIALEQVLGTR